jgi:general secretion pathway protein D
VSSRFNASLIACTLVLLAGCASSPEHHDQANSDILTPDTILKPVAPVESGNPDTGISLSSQALTNQEPPKPELQVGTGKFFTKVPSTKAAASGEADVVFNFENQPVQAVIKAVLGDLLQENYTIASNVGGNVTFSTAKPIHRSEALSVLETLLAANGISLVRDNNRYSVVLTKDAIPGRLSPNTLPAASAKGYELRIFPLQYISPSEMAKLLKPYAKPEAFINIDPNRSLLVMSGTASELSNYQQTIETFDVDWLKGMSIGVYTLQHVDVTKLLPDLLKIFGTEGESPLAGMFRFMPIEQTNSLVVITPQPEYLKSAEEWLYRLDRGGAENATQLYVYNVKNLKAPDLADYLSQIFLGTTGTSHSKTVGSVAPGLRPTTLGTRGGGSSTLGGTNTTMSYQNSLRPQSQSEKNAPASTTPSGAAGAAAPGGAKETDIRISAIEENNQLMIQATPIEWARIEAAIKKLDIIPLQVQIEARILEVSLTGDLNFGVQWYLTGLIGTSSGSAQENGQYPYAYPPGSGPTFTGNSHDRHRLSLGATGNTKPTGDGGFFYSFLNKNFEVAINALESNGQAKSLAAPSLLVANNQEAQINVGTQIPVVQTYYNGLGSVNTNGTTSLAQTGSVQYLNTGVTLDVKPRVNPGGLVYLDIQQEVSNPGAPAVTGGNPPINQRLIQTQVAVQSGETLLLGGLIQANQTTGENGLPLISKVPFLRNLFGNTKNHKDRTELIVLITPRVISNTDEARQVTLEYTRQFQSLAPMHNDMPHTATPPLPPPPPPAATEPVKPEEGTPNGH